MNVQDLAAAAVVLLAIAYLTRGLWWRGSAATESGCGSCGSCANASESSAPRELVVIERPRQTT